MRSTAVSSMSSQRASGHVLFSLRHDVVFPLSSGGPDKKNGRVLNNPSLSMVARHSTWIRINIAPVWRSSSPITRLSETFCIETYIHRSSAFNERTPLSPRLLCASRRLRTEVSRNATFLLTGDKQGLSYRGGGIHTCTSRPFYSTFCNFGRP